MDKIIRIIAELKNMPRVRKELNALKNNMRGVAKAGQRVSRTVKVADGQLLRVSGTMSKSGKGLTKMNYGLMQMNKGFAAAHPILGQYWKALSRVAIVVPMWMAARVIIQSFLGTITKGIQTIRDLSREMIRASSVIHGTTMSISTALAELETKVLTLSVKTGISVDKITNAFYRFGTVGNNFRDSLSGMNAALMTSIAMQGDLTETAKTMALTYKLLGSTMNDNIPVAQQQLLMGAKLFQLYRTNAFEINEMNGALRQFLPTAKTANFTYGQSIALLAALQSAGLKGSKAGRTLRTSIAKLVQNLDVLASELGVAVNPEMENTFDVLMKVLGAIKKMEVSAKKLPINQLKAISKIFGGVRSQQAMKAAVALFDQLNMNLGDVADSAANNNKRMREFKDRVDEVTNSTDNLMKKNENLQGLIGQAFLQGLTHSKDLNESALRFNKILTTMKEKVKDAGDAIRIAFIPPILYPYIAITDAIEESANAAGKFADKVREAVRVNKEGIFEGVVGADDIAELMRELEDKELRRQLVIMDIDPQSYEKSLRQAYERAEGKGLAEFKVTAELNKKRFEIEIAEKLKILEKKIPAIKLDVKVRSAIEEGEKALELARMKLQDMTKEEMAQEKLNSFIKTRVKLYNKIVEGNKVGLKSITEQWMMETAMKGTMEEIVFVMKEANFPIEKQLELTRLILKAKIGILQTADKIRDTENKRIIEELQAQGATGTQVAQRRLDLAKTEKEIANARHRLMIEQTKELTKQAKVIQDIGKASFREFLDTGDLNSFFNTFREGLREATFDAMSEGMMNLTFQATGLDKMLGMGLESMKFETAIVSGANLAAPILTQAIVQGAQQSVGVGEGAPGGMNLTGGKPKAGGGLLGGGGFDWGKMLGFGMMAWTLFGGGKGSSNVSQKYGVAPTGREVAATTRMTTKAKITNIVNNVTFNLDGMSIDEQKTMNVIGNKIGKIIKETVKRVLEEENIGSGNA